MYVSQSIIGNDVFEEEEEVSLNLTTIAQGCQMQTVVSPRLLFGLFGNTVLPVKLKKLCNYIKLKKLFFK
jgi:hypothetical protein